MTYCLETDFLVDLFRGNPAAQTKLAELAKNPDQLCITPVSATEIFKGAFKRGDPNKLARIEETFLSFRLLEFDLLAARVCGETLNTLSKKGEMIGEMDKLTGAICARHNQILVTKNKKHFQKIYGLKTQDW